VLRVPNAALRFRPPEGAAVKGGTNAPAAGAPTGSPAGTNEFAAAPAAERGDSPNREEARKRFESLSPEERAQMRERRRARSGDDSPGGFGRGMGGGARAVQDGPVTRTVYVADKEADAAQPRSFFATLAGWIPGLNSGSQPNPSLKPISIKTGISDGSTTEVLEGLGEGDVVITGVNLPASAASAARPANSPFGTPFGGPRGPR
jgi:HlyD family secretion protein